MSTSSTIVVQKPLVLGIPLEEYEDSWLRTKLANIYAIPEESISLDVNAGSLQVLVTFHVNETLSAMMNITSIVDSVHDATLSSHMQVNVSSLPARQAEVVQQVGRCPGGSFCPSGAVAPIPCPGGTHSDSSAVMVRESQCIECSAGAFCSVGAMHETECAPGTFNNATRKLACLPCSRGSYQDTSGATVCKPCKLGYYCAAGAPTAIPCPAGSYGNRTDLYHADQCSMAPPGFFSIIGSPAPTPCQPGFFAAASGSAACERCPSGMYTSIGGAVVCTTCAPGHWCSAIAQIPCSENTYNAFPGAHLITNCSRCPERTSTLRASGATSILDCSCSADFYLAPNWMDVVNRAECRGSCCTCPVGAQCDNNALLPITLSDLPIMAGYYRLSNDQIDVRRCPDAAANCPAGMSVCPNSTSACAGGRDADTACQPGLNGTFCRSCIEPFKYFVSAEAGAVAHCELCENAVSNGLTSVLGIIAVVLGLAALFCFVFVRFYRGGCLQTVRAFGSTLINQYRLPTKLKVLIGFYQIAIKVETVYEIYLPAEVRVILHQLRIIVSLGIEGVPLTCIGADGYIKRLLFWMIVPFVLIATAGLIVVVHLRSCRHVRTLSVDVFLQHVAPVVLRGFFLLYPIVTNTAFEAFSCFRFENGKGWLVVDVTIECDTHEHDVAKKLATVAILLFPVGIFAFNAVLLARAGKAIRLKQPSKLSCALSFLHADFKPEMYAWELAEMVRRLLLVGVFVVWPFNQGTIMQLAIANLAALIYLYVQLQVVPYQDLLDDYLARACSLSIVVMLLCCNYYKLSSLIELPDIHNRLSRELKVDYTVPGLILSGVFVTCILGTLVFSALLLMFQLGKERHTQLQMDRAAKARRLRYISNGAEVVPSQLLWRGHFHLFLSHVCSRRFEQWQCDLL